MLSEGVVGTVAVLLLLLLLAGFLIRARVKLRALEDEARRRGLVVHLPFTADPASPLDALAVALDLQDRGSRGLWQARWGVGGDRPFRRARAVAGRSRGARQLGVEHPHRAPLDAGAATAPGTRDAQQLGHLLQHAPEALRWFR